MKIIEPSFKLLIPEDCREGVEMLQTIERFARISHRAEEKQTDDSWARFILLRPLLWTMVTGL